MCSYNSGSVQWNVDAQNSIFIGFGSCYPGQTVTLNMEAESCWVSGLSLGCASHNIFFRYRNYARVHVNKLQNFYNCNILLHGLSFYSVSSL